MPTRLTGRPSLAYEGVEAPQPPNIVAIRRAPTVNDYLTFNTGDLWIDISSLYNTPPTAPTNEDIWMLVSKNKQIANATWVNMGGGDLETLTGNVGGPVPPDGADNINTVGDGIGITVVGNPGANTLTWSLVGGGVATQSYLTDDALVEVPDAGGQLTVTGTGVVTVGNIFSNTNTLRGVNVNTVGVALNNSIGQPFTTADASAGVYSLGVTDLDTDRFMHAYGTGNTFLGRQSGNLTLTIANAQANTCVGSSAGTALVGAAANQGEANTFIGATAGASATNASHNSFIGGGSGQLITTGNNNSCLGSGSLDNATTASNNSCVGALSGDAYASTESSNIVMGFSNVGRVGENNTIRIGVVGEAAGTNNIFIGRDTGTSAYTVATAIDNTFVGSAAGGAALTTGTLNTIIGSLAGSGGITTGSNNCFFGYDAGSAYTLAASSNITIGAGNLGNVGENNIIRIGSIGFAAGGENVFIGRDSGNFTYTVGVGNCEFNVGTGSRTLMSVTVARGNSAYGHSALASITSSTDCAAFGYTSMSLLQTGNRNCAYGNGSLSNVLTGSDNVGIGDDAGNAYTGAESSNILIGSSVVGTVGESNTLRIGNGTGAAATNLNQAFIAGIRGITTGVNDAIPVLIDSADQLGTVSSSERYKDNIEDMDAYSDDILSLRCVMFNFKKHSPEIVSVGLIAEEVEDIMPQLVVKNKEGLPETVRYLDLIPMLLNEVQKLEKRVKELEDQCSN